MARVGQPRAAGTRKAGGEEESHQVQNHMLRIGKGAQVPSLDRWDTWMREAGEAHAGLKLDITTPGPLPQTRL